MTDHRYNWDADVCNPCTFNEKGYQILLLAFFHAIEHPQTKSIAECITDIKKKKNVNQTVAHVAFFPVIVKHALFISKMSAKREANNKI